MRLALAVGPELRAKLHRRLGVLGQRNFALLWFGLVLSNTGTWMQLTAQGWLVYQLTGSPLWLGAVGGARAIPMIALPFFGGVLADRMDRRRCSGSPRSAPPRSP